MQYPLNYVKIKLIEELVQRDCVLGQEVMIPCPELSKKEIKEIIPTILNWEIVWEATQEDKNICILFFDEVDAETFAEFMAKNICYEINTYQSMTEGKQNVSYEKLFDESLNERTSLMELNAKFRQILNKHFRQIFIKEQKEMREGQEYITDARLEYIFDMAKTRVYEIYDEMDTDYLDFEELFETMVQVAVEFNKIL